ncbi:MAG: hypothetical protein R6V02_02120 [Candidatus Aminicenantes bacterium]
MFRIISEGLTPLSDPAFPGLTRFPALQTVPRPAIYTGAEHPVVNCAQVTCAEPPNITVAGNLCETGDLFAREIPMAEPKSGDILAMLVAGAYCRSMASRFNLRDIPQEILI